jgi:hypothetical protein
MQIVRIPVIEGDEHAWTSGVQREARDSRAIQPIQELVRQERMRLVDQATKMSGEIHRARGELVYITPGDPDDAMVQQHDRGRR